MKRLGTLVCECCGFAGPLAEVCWHDGPDDTPEQGAFLCVDKRACDERLYAQEQADRAELDALAADGGQGDGDYPF